MSVEHLIEVARELKHLVRNSSDFKISSTIIQTDKFIIYRAIEKKSQLECQIKEIKLGNNNENWSESYLKEISILEKCKHRSVNQLIGFTIKPPYYIITEYFPSGNMRDCMYKANGKIGFSGHHMTTIALAITHAMEFIHSKGITHRHLTIGNIDMDDKKMPRIAHFENARFADETSAMASKVGQPRSAPTEIIGDGKKSFKTDVFSFAFILYEMAEGRDYFKDKTDNEITAIQESSERPEFTNTPEALQNLIIKCWSQDPDKRPSFSEIWNLFSKGNVVFNKTDPARIVKIAIKLNENYQPSLPEAFVTSTVNVESLIKQIETQDNRIIKPPPAPNKYVDFIPYSNEPSIEIDRKLLSNPSSPKFLDYFQKISAKVNDNTAELFYEITSQYLTPKTPQSIRIFAFQLYFQTMTHARKLIDVCYDSQLYFNLPMSNEDLIDCSLDLLSALFTYHPTYATSELVSTMESLIKRRPANTLSVYAMYIRRLPPLQLSLPLLKVLARSVNIYAGNDSKMLSYIRFWALAISNNLIIRNVFQEELTEIARTGMRSSDLAVLDEVYCFAVILNNPNFPLDVDSLIRALSASEFVGPVISLLIRHEAIPVSRRLSELLIKWALQEYEALRALLVFISQSSEAAVMLARSTEWTRAASVENALDTLYILLTVLNWPEARPVMAENEFCGRMLTQLARTRQAFTLMAVSTAAAQGVRTDLSLRLVEKSGFIPEISAALAAAADPAVHSSGLVMIESLARLRFSEQIAAALPSVVKIIGARNSASSRAITTLANISGIPAYVPALQKLNLTQYYSTLLSIAEYEPYARTFLSNIK